ncbi:MAG: hypothetical protein KDK78_02365 [Chlamydiia bacterium]|nr:hypothetical protein [Chlamydiia bacterium]
MTAMTSERVFGPERTPEEICRIMLCGPAVRAVQELKRLGVLRDGILRSGTLAKELKLEAQILERFFRVAWKLGLLQRSEGGYELTSMGRELREREDALCTGENWDQYTHDASNLLEDPTSDLDRVLRGPIWSRVLYTAVQTGLMESIQASADLNDAELLMARVLEKIGFTKFDDGRFAVTSDGALLLDADPDSKVGSILLSGEERWRAYEHIGESLHGRIPFEMIHQKSYFDYLQDHPELSRIFDRSMAEISVLERAWLRPWIARLNAPSFVDVGGGTGQTLQQVCEVHPDMEVTLFDLDAEGQHLPLLEGRCSFKNGSFFEPATIPATDGVYMLKRVLHDWDDAEVEQILRNIASRMHSNASIWIVEPILIDDDALSLSDLTDIYLLPLMNGKERSVDAYRILVESAGLKVADFEALGGHLSALRLIPQSGSMDIPSTRR